MANNLFINLYKDSNEDRMMELDECFNMNKKVFDNLFVLCEDHIEGIHHIPFNGIPTFHDFFQIVNKVSSHTDINVISNSDIYFKKTNFDSIRDKECYALTRWEDRTFFARDDSQDSWIFRGHVNVSDCQFRLGLRGSDNAIANRLRKSGYKVSNPSMDIRSYHIHKSEIRNYKSIYAPQPYDLSIKPSTILDNNIVFATSINPFDRIEEQHRAINTWGDIVISINTRSEIDILSQMHEFDNVIFIETSDTNGKYIKLDAILLALKRIEASRYVLINSDISIRDYDEFIKEMISDKFILGVRNDIQGKDEHPFVYGYDVFAFRRNQLDIINKSDFALGLPFWDFYVPLSLIRKDQKIRVVRGLFTHEYHETRYDHKAWIKMGEYSKQIPVFEYRNMSLPDFTTKNKQLIESKL